MGVRLTVVYDNKPHHPELPGDWGFACHVQAGGRSILFDTGAEGPMLLENLRRLGLDAKGIDLLVISHDHWDHTGGIAALLQAGVCPAAIIPEGFSDETKSALSGFAELIELSGPAEIAPGIHSTGPMPGRKVEHALALEAEGGATVITGCAHPGITAMLRRAREQVGGELDLVIGGFHLKDMSEVEVAAVIAEMRELGVRRVAPCHCTGDQAIAMFAAEYGEDYLAVGTGRVIA